MRTGRVLYHIVRADFLERSRSYSFLILLCLSLYLGYAINMGQIVLRFNTCKEIFDTALVGVMMAIAIGFFLGFFGFYLVKGSIQRDETTGVGQIMAATPLHRLQYVFGKWISYLAVLGVLLCVQIAVTALIQYFRIPGINLAALLGPFALVTFPFLALVAALAVLFETIGFLKGGVGNLVYFFLFVVLLIVLTSPSVARSSLLSDPSGIRMLLREIKTAGLDCGAHISLAEMGRSIQDITWNGVSWSADVLISRLGVLGVAVGLVAGASAFFDRFNTRSERRPRLLGAPKPERLAARNAEIPQAGREVRLTPLTPKQNGNLNLWRITLAEIRLALKGNHWAWYIGVLGLWIALLLSPEQYLPVWLSFMTLWPLLVWSKMGSRELVYRTNQVVFSCARPLLRILLPSWIAGVLVTAALWSGAAIRFGLHHQLANLAAWGLAVLLIPSLALMLGVWTGTSKVFEVIYLILWYIGIVNRLPALDFLGLTAQAAVYQYPVWMLALLTAFVLLAFVGRKLRQVV